MPTYDDLILRFRRKTFSRNYNLFLDIFYDDYKGYHCGYTIYKGFKVAKNLGLGLIEKIISIPVTKEIFVFAGAYMYSEKKFDKERTIKPVRYSINVSTSRLQKALASSISCDKTYNISTKRLPISKIGGIECVKTIDISRL